jgi:hypothetical protein
MNDPSSNQSPRRLLTSSMMTLAFLVTVHQARAAAVLKATAPCVAHVTTVQDGLGNRR